MRQICDLKREIHVAQVLENKWLIGAGADDTGAKLVGLP